ncbi:MAG TPA: hypothetical protein VH142_16590 [Polyangiaceae bacterium]|nr:hypothetical protein [Polyangiaceae bacterium]
MQSGPCGAGALVVAGGAVGRGVTAGGGAGFGCARVGAAAIAGCAAPGDFRDTCTNGAGGVSSVGAGATEAAGTAAFA